MNKSTALLGVMAAMSENNFVIDPKTGGCLSSIKEMKVCKYSKCDKKHTHNNACCSAEHYKLWRQEKP